MFPKSEVLEIMDNSNDGYYHHFVPLGHAYSYLIDSRLNVFRRDDQWAIAIERLGYNPRAGGINLEIYYYGNCLQNLEVENERTTNYYFVSPVDYDQFMETIDGESIKQDAQFWLVRGEQVPLSHNKADYENAGIELKEYQPGEIGIEEAARLLIPEYASLFRASDEELYKSIPKELRKIMVLDEWYHKDFYMQKHEPMTDKQLRQAYELNKQYSSPVKDMAFEEFAVLSRKQEERNRQADQEEWENNRPSTYDTWQQIAKVIETGDTACYQPTLKPNTHWINFPESGSL